MPDVPVNQVSMRMTSGHEPRAPGRSIGAAR
jgi:hypothetical protein